ncbi:hypothetical protein BPOR_0120g00120 [Botrytis porri]|uniref:Uncharacterized protein n=1 Tax=Botrytis porri TaxID=87229 RepID=A0A4Z1KXD8_9HELO|nr:hypothetical protein BPOR_0120g00120 [Botrytis porri]
MTRACGENNVYLPDSKPIISSSLFIPTSSGATYPTLSNLAVRLSRNSKSEREPLEQVFTTGNETWGLVIMYYRGRNRNVKFFGSYEL